MVAAFMIEDGTFAFRGERRVARAFGVHTTR